MAHKVCGFAQNESTTQSLSSTQPRSHVMGPSKSSIDELSGFLGVGSLQLLAIFFILDGTTGFLKFLEDYAHTNTWSILVSLPLLVVAYVFGLISCLGMEAIFEGIWQSSLRAEIFYKVTESKNETLLQKYLDAERHIQLLNGCVAAFVLLGIGSLAEVRQMPSYEVVGYLGLGGGLLTAILCRVLCWRLERKIHRLVTTVI